MTNPLINSLERAVQAAPDDVPLRLHLAEQLISAGRGEEAIAHCAMALQHSPGDQTARDLMTRALSPAPTAVDDAPSSAGPTTSGTRPHLTEATATEPTAGAPTATEPTAGEPPARIEPTTAGATGPGTVNAGAAEAEPARAETGHDVEHADATPASEAPTPPTATTPGTTAPAINDARTPQRPGTPGSAAQSHGSQGITVPPAHADPTEATEAESTDPTDPAEASTAAESPAGTDSPTDDPSPTPTGSPADTGPAQSFDWARAEEDLGPGPAAPFVSGTEPLPPERQPAYGLMPSPEDWEVEAPGLALADVGGLQDVKDRLEASFLAPMRNPELRRIYGKSLRGGLLLYGPPGVGKTFIARAVAGEMGAGFLNVTITDILDQFIGNSEAKLHAIFNKARTSAPCVLFLDELDAIGIKRSLMRSAGMRGVINQLLQELDGIGADNRGIYVLAATNAPWDINPALRRPGRLDRAILVLPPDEPARSAILRTHLKDRPIEGINLAYLARVTDGLTGADLSHVCDTAAEKALLDSVRTGTPRMIQMPDILAALAEVRPSTGPWFDVARNVVEYADHSGEYADLRAWMKRHRML